MATINPFDVLGDDDNDDPSQLIAAQQQQLAAKKPALPTAVSPVVAKLPTKPLPPSQAVRESKEARDNVAPARGGAGRGRGGGRGPNRDFGNENSNGYNRPYGGGRGGGEDGEVDKPERVRPPHQPFSCGRRGGYGGRGGYGNGEFGGNSERPPRRLFERRSGTGRGEEVKRQGGGRGNWGSATDETLAQEKDDVMKSDENLPTEGHAVQENAPITEESKDKEGTTNETEEKEEDKEMTLEEYEKVKEEKRKALLALKAEERKVEIDKDLQAMQLLATKKEIDPIFVKLGSDKDIGKKKDNADRDEKSRKPLNMNEFFKTGDGKQSYSSGGRGRGRGRGNRAPFGSGFGGRGTNYITEAPSIEDPGQFPTLGGK
ncbi:RGG repeats nuclear RNA binding protein A-like [Zingiber officinale]|uniref:RGG repeats nuclear RNA binding protein A-like n=1 Tax=Zingiber officinale TaxID=94328 RepID=UPI001C4A79C0|nr:RGG repeats nuclear RNA binding protein A-like [Zingiber officinale]